VRAAGEAGSPRCREALSTLCEIYWYPIYAYARRTGAGREEAQDLSQEFFTRFLERDALRHVHPDKGRFRSFLLICFKNFLKDEQSRRRAQKRGGGRSPVPIDLETAERLYVREPSHAETPERFYERRWALTVLSRSLDRLRNHYAESNRRELFDRIKDYLPGERGGLPHAETARMLNMSEVAVKVAVHRLRRRFRDHLVEEVSQTLAEGEDLDAEIRRLISALET
jgi:RNA polymerase sigma-70 factor (ECF subfamily)